MYCWKNNTSIKNNTNNPKATITGKVVNVPPWFWLQHLITLITEAAGRNEADDQLVRTKSKPGHVQYCQIYSDLMLAISAILLLNSVLGYLSYCSTVFVIKHAIVSLTLKCTSYHSQFFMWSFSLLVLLTCNLISIKARLTVEQTACTMEQMRVQWNKCMFAYTEVMGIPYLLLLNARDTELSPSSAVACAVLYLTLEMQANIVRLTFFI